MVRMTRPFPSLVLLLLPCWSSELLQVHALKSGTPHDLSIDQVFSFGAPGWIYETNAQTNITLSGLRMFNSRWDVVSKSFKGDFMTSYYTWRPLCYHSDGVPLPLFPCYVHPAGLPALQVHGSVPKWGTKLMGSKKQNMLQPAKRNLDIATVHYIWGSSGYYRGINLSCSTAPALCDVGNTHDHGKVNMTLWKALLELVFFDDVDDVLPNPNRRWTQPEKSPLLTSREQLFHMFDEAIVVIDTRKIDVPFDMYTVTHPWHFLDQQRHQHSWFVRQGETCYLTFPPTYGMRSWIANARDHSLYWCELGEVHAGFAAQTGSLMANKTMIHIMKEKFFNSAVCRKRMVIGYSMGGAAAEMFSACAQKAGTRLFDWAHAEE